MKKSYEYNIKGKKIKKEYEYIPLRYILSMTVIVAEIVLIIGLVMLAFYYSPYLYLLAVAVQIVCAVRIISSDDNPEYKAPWLLTVIILPVVGFMLYFIFYSRQMGKLYVRRLNDISKGYYKKDDSNDFERLKEENELVYTHAKMLCNTADSHLFSDTKLKYFSCGSSMMQSLLKDLERAEKFIYLEFFIIEEGKFWNSILDILNKKVNEGVEVKVIYDDIGCMRTLPGNYARKLKKQGIEATAFSYLKPVLSGEFNNRTHRKIAIIDGYIGYTGGVNLADEYINEIKRFGYWKDCAIRLEGECVWELTELFLTDYGVNVLKMPTLREDLYPTCANEEDGYVIPFGDGPSPMYQNRVAKSAIKNLIDSSTKYCWITTPYLIPDNDICLSLENAALRGVDVVIVTPDIPDKRIVFAITKSYYPRLMKAGVKIYQYTPGFIHAKSYLADGKNAIIGTVNLDYRSLAHNFENGVWLYKTKCIEDIEADLKQVISESKKIDKKMLKINPLRKFMRGIIKIFAPLM